TSVTRLDEFGFLSITGKDAMKFLQGYATCDLADISDTRSAIGATCNLKGRMVASFVILRIDDGYLLRMRRELVPTLIDFLSRYIVFSKAEMTDLSDSLYCHGVIGAVEEFPGQAGSSIDINAGHVVRVSSRDRFEVWSHDPDYTLEDVETGSIDEWTACEIEDGIAWISGSTSEEFIPQMFGYHEIGAVDFDKGCYLGQEIVARMQYRGNLNRVLHRGSTPSAVQVGDWIQDGDSKRVGTVVSCAHIGKGSVFLAVINAKDNLTPDCFLPGGEALTVERVTRA
ncbi:MAG: hypothetical protein WD558_04145, partial [Pseudomonadales bacterium]